LGYAEKEMVFEEVDLTTETSAVILEYYLSMKYAFLYRYVVVEAFPCVVHEVAQYVSSQSPHVVNS
jgi:hypothetical protein